MIHNNSFNNTGDVNGVSSNIDALLSSNAKAHSNQLLSSLPSREQLLKELNGVNESISNLNDRLVVAKSQSNSEKNSETTNNNNNNNKNVKKNKIEQIYFENRKKCQEAYNIFDSLLPDSMIQDNSLSPLQDVDISKLPFVKESIAKFAEISAELEKNILTRWESIHCRNLELGEQYRTMRQKWKETRRPMPFDEESDEDLSRYTKVAAVCPPMLNEEEKKMEFVGRNGFVDTETVYREQLEQRIYECSWTEEEKKIFMQKFAQYPKNCKKIATFLSNKTTYDCVNFYYNNKFKPEFVALREKLKRFTKKLYDEGPGTRNKNSIMEPDAIIREQEGGRQRTKPRRTNNSTADEDWTEADTTSFISLLEKHGRNFNLISQYMKGKSSAQCQKFFNLNKKRLELDSYIPTYKPNGPNKTTNRPNTRRNAVNNSTVDHLPAVEEAIPASSKKTKKQVSIWTNKEKEIFLDLLLEVGRNWQKIAEHLPNKTENQIKNFFQNYKVKLGITAPGMKKSKKMKRASLVTTPPSELCKLAEIANQVKENGTASTNNEFSLLCDESSLLSRESMINSAPPPPPSLSTIVPNMEYKQYSKEIDPLLKNVDLLASTALQYNSNTSLKDSTNVQSVKSNSEPPAAKKAPKTTTKRKVSNAGTSASARGRKPSFSQTSTQQHSPMQQYQSPYMQNGYNPMYGLPGPALLNLPTYKAIQTRSGIDTTSSYGVVDESLTAVDNAAVAKAQLAKQNQAQQSVPVQQTWFTSFPSLINHNADVLLPDLNPFPTQFLRPQSPIDLIAHEVLSTEKKTQQSAMLQQNKDPSNRDSVSGASVPLFHAFFPLLSKIPLSECNNPSTSSKGPIERNNERKASTDQPSSMLSPSRQENVNIARTSSNSPPKSGAPQQKVSIQDLDTGKVGDLLAHLNKMPKTETTKQPDVQPSIAPLNTSFPIQGIFSSVVNMNNTIKGPTAAAATSKNTQSSPFNLRNSTALAGSKDNPVSNNMSQNGALSANSPSPPSLLLPSLLPSQSLTNRSNTVNKP
jgi:hypothetical protein